MTRLQRSLVSRLVLLALGSTSAWASSEPSGTETLFGEFGRVDRYLGLAGEPHETRAAWDGLVRIAMPCRTEPELERCLVQRMFASSLLMSTDREASLASNTFSHVVVKGNGTCTSLVAATLALAESLGASLEPVVFSDHILLRERKRPGRVYELTQGGRLIEEWEFDTPVPNVVVSPEEFVGYYLDNLAARLIANGRAEDAEWAFEEALGVAPRAARIHYDYGAFLLERGRPEEALDRLTAAVDLGQRGADAFVDRGAAYWKVGQLPKARKDFRRALKIDPGNSRATISLAHLEEAAAD